MRSLLYLFSILPLLPLVTHAVKVVLEHSINHPQPALAAMMAQVCNNLRPGRCCQGRPVPQMLGISPGAPAFRNYRVARFEGLAILDIAAVWQPQGSTGGCSGTPRDTTIGPGNWRYPDVGDSDVTLTGGSYIKLPTSIPKGQSAPMLEAQGILGLITGGGKWVSKQAGSTLLQQAARAALLLAAGSQGHQRRGIRSKDKGVVFAQPPGESVWPDLIMVNGTNYTEESVGSAVYRSEEGLVLNFTEGAT